jgi:hypothetical protein
MPILVIGEKSPRKSSERGQNNSKIEIANEDIYV